MLSNAHKDVQHFQTSPYLNSKHVVLDLKCQKMHSALKRITKGTLSKIIIM